MGMLGLVSGQLQHHLDCMLHKMMSMLLKMDLCCIYITFQMNLTF